MIALHRIRTLSILVMPLTLTCGGDGESSPTTPDPPDPPPPPNQLPLASFTADLEEGPAPLVVSFDAAGSSDPDGSIVAHTWSFGDGSSATGPQASHTFDGVGSFVVELTVRDDRGGESSARDTVYVFSPPGPGANTIEGTVWFDEDLDGARSPDEPGLHRFVVFLDQDGDGDHDSGEALAFTGPGGEYAFEGLSGSTDYTVTQTLPFGWSNTTPGPGTAPPPAASPRIINGEGASIDQFPFQVALMSGNFQFCGGTLINSRYVLTAAHCLAGLVSQDVDILIGTADLTVGGERVGSTAIRIHPEYSSTLDYDVALLRLERSLLRPRAHLQTPDQGSLSAPGQMATVIGWGQKEDGSSSSLLLRADVPIITNDECGKIAGAFFGGIGPRTICAGAERLLRGPCFGDSGGPLLVPHAETWVQVGIVSFAVNQDQCGNIPAAYARVTELYDYIVSVARLEASGAVAVDWSSGPVAQADFGNFH